jgi:hypothetical protein
VQDQVKLMTGARVVDIERRYLPADMLGASRM